MGTTVPFDEISANIARIQTLQVADGRFGDDKYDFLTDRLLALYGEHMQKAEFRIASGTNIAAVSSMLAALCYNSTIVEVAIAPEVAPTGDYVYTVDIQYGNEGNAFATLLTTPLTFSVAASSANRKTQYASLDSTKVARIRGDLLKYVIGTPTGTTGAVGTGLIGTVRYFEHPAAS